MLEEDNLFFKLCDMERQIDEKLLKKQNEIAASSFRSNKLRRNLKIYVSNSFAEAESSGGLSSLASIGNASNENISSLPGDSPVTNGYGGCWILRIEGKIDQTGLSTAALSGSSRNSQQHQQAARPQPPKKFSHHLKSMIVEVGDEIVVEWNKYSADANSNCDGFEIRRPCDSSNAVDIPCKIHLQFDFAPERFRLAPALASLLNMTLATRPAIVVALWQYIKLHKLQESDEKKIINNDAALQELFKVPRMSFSDIPVLVEPYLLPPETVTINYVLRNSRQELNVLDQVFEVEVDIDDPKGGSSGRSLSLPPNLYRDLNFYEGRLRELLEALQASQTNYKLLKSFASDPVSTAQKILKSCAKDFETVVGDLPVTLEELRSAEFYESEVVGEAVTEFLALNPRFLPQQ